MLGALPLSDMFHPIPSSLRLRDLLGSRRVQHRVHPMLLLVLSSTVNGLARAEPGVMLATLTDRELPIIEMSDHDLRRLCRASASPLVLKTAAVQLDFIKR